MSTTYHDNEIKIIEHVMRALRRQINPSNATGKKNTQSSKSTFFQNTHMSGIQCLAGYDCNG